MNDTFDLDHDDTDSDLRAACRIAGTDRQNLLRALGLNRHLRKLYMTALASELLVLGVAESMEAEDGSSCMDNVTRLFDELWRQKE
ncbi:MAG TPA: hypothetical protein PKA88_32880 [Polyangiaceae bacterium]|nr:hypothetical protein [Polyangiaceae bacterium]